MYKQGSNYGGGCGGSDPLEWDLDPPKGTITIVWGVLECLWLCSISQSVLIMQGII